MTDCTWESLTCGGAICSSSPLGPVTSPKNITWKKGCEPFCTSCGVGYQCMQNGSCVPAFAVDEQDEPRRAAPSGAPALLALAVLCILSLL